MDIETLREVITAFQQLGGEAKEAFVWYLLFMHLPGLLIGLGWTAIGGVVLLKGVRLLQGLQCSGALKDAAGLGWGDWAPSELKIACESLREHYPKP